MTTIETNIPAEFPIIDTYWVTLHSLSDDIKLRLAAMLTESVGKNRSKSIDPSLLTQRMLDKYTGSWKGEESADEIMSTIRENSSIREAIEL